MKATFDTFVPTHIKGPFEGHTLLVSRAKSGVNTAGEERGRTETFLSISLHFVKSFEAWKIPMSTHLKSNHRICHL